MSFLDTLKSIVGSALDSKEDPSAIDLIKEQIQSGHLKSVDTVLEAILGTDGSGLKELIKRFEAVNLQELIYSWLSEGKSLPFSLEEVVTVFGKKWLHKLADQIGINSTVLQGMIASFLPAILAKAHNCGMVSKNNTSAHFDVKDLVASLIK